MPIIFDKISRNFSEYIVVLLWTQETGDKETVANGGATAALKSRESLSSLPPSAAISATAQAILDALRAEAKRHDYPTSLPWVSLMPYGIRSIHG